jgi:hypothetical protein
MKETVQPFNHLVAPAAHEKVTLPETADENSTGTASMVIRVYGAGTVPVASVVPP